MRRARSSGERAFPHGGAGLAALCDWLVSIAGDAGAVAVAIEVPHGPVVDALLDRGFAVHAINPKQLDRLRDRFSVAGAKDDRRDARVAAAGLRTDRHLFRPVAVSDPAVIELREWSRLAEELQQERVRLGNRVRQQLWRYYPQLLELSDDVAAEWVLALWTHGTDPGQGGAPARGDAGAAAQAAPHPQGRCRDRARHPAPARDQGGRGRHRSGRPASPLPRRPAAPGQPRVPPGRAQAR